VEIDRLAGYADAALDHQFCHRLPIEKQNPLLHSFHTRLRIPVAQTGRATALPSVRGFLVWGCAGGATALHRAARHGTEGSGLERLLMISNRLYRWTMLAAFAGAEMASRWVKKIPITCTRSGACRTRFMRVPIVLERSAARHPRGGLHPNRSTRPGAHRRRGAATPDRPSRRFRSNGRQSDHLQQRAARVPQNV
jgi:hypothetical protein